MTQPAPRRQGGFTIIELMIATAVFSTILVLITTMMIAISSLYYKGMNQARVQDAVRTITDEVSSQLQLSGDVVPQVALVPPAVAPANGAKAYCLGNFRYTYVIGKQLVSTVAVSARETTYALWRDKRPATCEPIKDSELSDSAKLNGGVELIPPNGWLTEFRLSQVTSPYVLEVGVAYGEYDLLTLNGVASRCTGVKGNEYCATAHLSTTVTRRSAIN
jgi:prepilin-type N-terminal cleavage/methylation domain-containing protein